MKKLAFIAAALASGVGASQAAAQTYQGSDTLEALSRAVTDACAEAPAQTYVGGGSTTGETAMTQGLQDIAPMSRELSCNVVDPAGGMPPKNSCAINVADDALGVFRSAPAAAACTNINNARNVLRLVYFGLGPNGNGTGIALVNGRLPGCNGADGASGVAAGERNTLLSAWSNLFGGACAGDACQGPLRHAFRRNDLSGTTDVFRDRMGVSTGTSPAAPAPGVPVVPFCNGNDEGFAPSHPPAGYSGGTSQQDLDPIRRSCLDNPAGLAEDVCGPFPRSNEQAPFSFPARTLGVVLSIAVPTAFTGVANPTLAQLFNPTACTNQFALRPNPSPNPASPCPNGAPPVLNNQCFLPVDAAGNFNCLKAVPNIACPAGSPANCDGRIYNLSMRDQTGNPRVQVATAGAAARRVNTAYYRIHTAGGAAGAGRSCQQADATRLIGCLTEADVCSVGFAGYEADDFGSSNALNLNGQPPLLNATTANPSYLIYRKLWINAEHCPTDVTYPYNGSAALDINRNDPATGTPVAPNNTAWRTLFQCFRTQGTAAAVAAGFFAPAGANVAPAVVLRSRNTPPDPATICPAQ